MKNRPDKMTERILVLLKLDARRLYERIKFREKEYLQIFSVRRTRSHFPEIFNNRYDSIRIEELKCCGQEVIVALDDYYSSVDEMRWFLNHTEEMPGTVEDRVTHFINTLDNQIEVVDLYVNAELGLVDVEEQSVTFNEENTTLVVESGDTFGDDIFSVNELPTIETPNEIENNEDS